ncbi:MAG: radical SAM protein [Deltaproteobacteria bacterium]|nr:radical SAM protein [Deltaproteobacteria bacterium]MBW2179221.1 radical SAM protein [Deltaproteobacteria bacterium]MBW2364372.1 radical SAM protein [Deltaproteobacteria bacterium]
MKKTVVFSRNSTNIFFHILTQCNLKCRHCYINPAQHGSNMLSLSTIEAWLSVLISPKKNANVIFLGGEPTMHPNLPGAMRKARELGSTSITIDTNGYLFNDILFKVGPDDVDYFSFSLDGATPKINDAIRGKGSYEKCIQGIKETKAKGFNASLIYTVSGQNIHELGIMERLLEDLGIDRFFIQVIGIRGKAAAESAKGLQIPRSQWLDTIPEVAQKISRHGITVTYPKVFLGLNESFECAGVVADNYFIFPNGRVYRCPLCEDFPINSLAFMGTKLIDTDGINEKDLFGLTIPEGCVMNKLIQPGNINYKKDGTPEFKIACCLLKEEVRG